MKKIILGFLVIFFLYSPIFPEVTAQENQVNLYLFSSKTCPHCTKEKAFLKKITPEYPYLKITDFEITTNRNNANILEEIGEIMSIDTSGIPLTIIGNDYLIGYGSDETTGQEIEKLIEKYYIEGDPDTVGYLINQIESESQVKQINDQQNLGQIKIPESIFVPVIGNISVSNLSLPALTVILGLLDGFNPCAMWVLLFLISLLLGMKDRKRMWLIGSVFILVSGLVYFLFLSAWLNLFLFVGFIYWVRIAVGILALFMGVYYLRDFTINKDAACKVTDQTKKQKIFERMKKIIHEKSLVLTLIGIIILAFSVNLIELICSAGLPALFTSVLSLHKLPISTYYFYLFVYIIFFMLDDMMIFAVAMTTLKIVGIHEKYSRFSRLLGGIIILLIGLALLLKPELITFG